MAKRGSDRFEALWARLKSVPDVAASLSMFSEKEALWVNGKEIAHVHEAVLDLRLTRTVIRELRSRLKQDGRVRFRQSGGDWIEFRVESAEDEATAMELFERAVAAHRPPAGEPCAAPPRGKDLERRRRFH